MLKRLKTSQIQILFFIASLGACQFVYSQENNTPTNEASEENYKISFESGDIDPRTFRYGESAPPVARTSLDFNFRYYRYFREAGYIPVGDPIPASSKLPETEVQRAVQNLNPWISQTYVAFNNLHDIERAAIRRYGSPGDAYSVVNTALRENQTEVIQQKELFIKSLISALNNLPADNHPTQQSEYRYFRGIHVESDELLRKIVDRYKSGAIVTEQSFLSTTTDKDSGYMQRSVIFIIKGKSARYIGDLMVPYYESEHLFAPGAKFKVDNTEEKRFPDEESDKKLIIYMTEQ